MDFSAWLQSLEQTRLATGIRDSLYLFPFLEALHVMALSVVFGTITIVDLRLLGLASTRRPFSRMSPDLLRITWGAFAVAAVTGALMFMTNARVYAHNTAFCVKMGLLVLAGINMVFFHLTTGRTVARWDSAPSAPALGKVAATLSVTIWIAVVFAGRVIGFTTTGAQAKEVAPTAVNFDDFLTPAADSPPNLGTQAVTSIDPAAVRNLSIQGIMAAMVDPSGDFLFESIAEIADEQGVTHKAPKTPQEWDTVRHHLQVLIDARQLLIEPGRKAAEPGARSTNPAVENEPEEVQRLLDSEHPDFVRRADRLADAARQGLAAVEARDTKALLTVLTAIDKACESCHLHYWYPRDKRAHQAAHEEGGIIE